MTFRISKGITPEERVAKRIKAIVEDLDLDLEQTGVMLARVLPHLTYTRLVTMIEVAQEEKEYILNPRKRHEEWIQNGLW
jgi:aminoglycoside phosphotransferase family enzyme